MDDCCIIFIEKGKYIGMSTDANQKLLADTGRRIRAVRNAQGLNLDQLARLTGISAPALSVIETAKRDPRLTTLARIAAALRVPLASLLEEASSGQPATTDEPIQGYDLGDYE